MNPREIYERSEKKMLAPYAQLSSKSLGRAHEELPCPFRPAFQLDMARIIHCTAFRRLEYKTQVFINHEDDHYRTRLTHTLEVSQIAKGLARNLQLNEDLAQAIALAHDLGHSPFGHPGEEALNELMKEEGGFDHNFQSYQVVTKLEKRNPNFSGLNLSYEVREGILKHATSYDRPRTTAGFKDAGHPTLEAQLVNFADEIAFISHDLDDSLLCGMITVKSLKDVALWEETFKTVRAKFPTAGEAILIYKTVSAVINALITDIHLETLKQLKGRKIKTLNDVRKRGGDIASFSPAMERKTKEAKAFLFENVYTHRKTLMMRRKAMKIIKKLFSRRLAAGKMNRRQICDYIAGLTDHMAAKEYSLGC